MDINQPEVGMMQQFEEACAPYNTIEELKRREVYASNLLRLKKDGGSIHAAQLYRMISLLVLILCGLKLCWLMKISINLKMMKFGWNLILAWQVNNHFGKDGAVSTPSCYTILMLHMLLR